MKYLANNPLLIAFLYFFDLCFAFSKKPKKTGEIKRILVTNPAHLGDVIMATAILRPLKENYPRAMIDFICGSWAKVALENHPSIHQIYLLDHWKISRRSESLLKKLWRYFSMKRKLIKTLRKNRYDLAIDLYMYFPNCAHLLWRAKVPMRVGFTSGGSIYTHEVPWLAKKEYLPESYRDLLAELSISPKELKMQLAEAKGTFLKEPYLIFHMGSDAWWRKWEKEKWAQLLELCSFLHMTIAFTGRGEQESRDIREVIKDTAYALDFCDKLSFSQWQSALQGARLLVSVETSAMHLAAAVGTPSLILLDTKNCPELWSPPSSVSMMKEGLGPEEVFKNICTIEQKL